MQGFTELKEFHVERPVEVQIDDFDLLAKITHLHILA